MVDAALCSCSRASYPGDGVTVGGAPLAGASEAQPPRATATAIARLVQNRFISFLPARPAHVAPPSDPDLACDHCHFKASAHRPRFSGPDLVRRKKPRTVSACL